VIIEEMSTFLGMLLNKRRKKKIGHLMMEKFATFHQFSHEITIFNKHYVDLGMVFKQSFKYLKKEKKDLTLSFTFMHMCMITF